MATILRDLSYRHQWLYNSISRLAAVAAGGEARFRQLALAGLAFDKSTQILDLCCGSGQTTRFLVERFPQSADEQALPVTGLDASPLSIRRAQQNVPQATFIEAWAEDMPFPDAQFDLVHTSAALHEMQPDQLRQILKECYRVLKPGGIFAAIDVHKPTNPLYMPGLAVFFWLFETETAWQFIQTDLPQLLSEVGFQTVTQTLHAGGSLQVLRGVKHGGGSE
ncbi:class I SAM-dependent methyltransferase [Thermoleptolyngbya oregonensis NK1-22]|uniref:Class I SAM-dependent methyltransferase n=1 Tax=Thermoleptolyngbya oregonensis NK1-22 TaxID=2547457 RepID=A0AA96Y4Y9_9CYAN|nr:class I SAM-dependent methyltransferase [Thermoleptolyngbya oregonensis]WOB44912.1 class I SAM-dependent methyltransferase [Thermoleptolyngbya oregonensis NK1-22]